MDQASLKSNVKKLRKGDKIAFKELFEAFHQEIFNFLLIKTKEIELAEDLLQETFLSLWKNRLHLDSNKSIKAYLYQIANNLFLNYIRHENIDRKYRNESHVDGAISKEHPQFLMEEDEFQKILFAAIDKLPDRTREVFLMSRIDNLPYREIAERLGISIKTVETHIGTALNKLSKSLPKQYFLKK